MVITIDCRNSKLPVCCPICSGAPCRTTDCCKRHVIINSAPWPRLKVQHATAVKQSRPQSYGALCGTVPGSGPRQHRSKDANVYPRFNANVRDAMDAEMPFFNHILFDSTQQFDELFNADYVFVNSAPLVASISGVNGNQMQMALTTAETEAARCPWVL